jgi:hypothetical protein
MNEAQAKRTCGSSLRLQTRLHISDGLLSLAKVDGVDTQRTRRCNTLLAII